MPLIALVVQPEGSLFENNAPGTRRSPSRRVIPPSNKPKAIVGTTQGKSGLHTVDRRYRVAEQAATSVGSLCSRVSTGCGYPPNKGGIAKYNPYTNGWEYTRERALWHKQRRIFRPAGERDGSEGVRPYLYSLLIYTALVPSCRFGTEGRKHLRCSTLTPVSPRLMYEDSR